MSKNVNNIKNNNVQESLVMVIKARKLNTVFFIKKTNTWGY